jgi:GNAT superfamily N-acetyltransferase
MQDQINVTKPAIATVSATNKTAKGNIVLKPAKNLAERMKWMQRFADSYAGGTRPINEAMFGPTVKMLIAVHGGKELGSVRIRKIDEPDLHLGENVWSVSEAYVKPAYRHQGVLREILEQVIRDHGVKMIHIERDRVDANSSYYQNLGFSEFWSKNDDLGYLAMKPSRRCQHASNDDVYNLCA